MSLVGLVKIRQGQLKRAIVDSLELINYEFSPNVRNIVIKPNMCYYWDYSTGYTTDPRFIESLIDVLREQISPKVNISIVESDASAMKCRYAFKILGYENLAKRCKVSLINLSDEKSENISTSVGAHTFNFRIPQIIREADLRINVPKIKYMQKVKITCALKNIFGCNPYSQKFVYHHRLDEAIVALNKVMKFDLCIVDGNIVSGCQTRRLELVLSGRDPVAIDSVAARIARVRPRSIKCIQLASREGIGRDAFIARGVAWQHFAARYPTTGAKSRLTSMALDIITRLHLDRRLGLD